MLKMRPWNQGCPNPGSQANCGPSTDSFGAFSSSLKTRLLLPAAFSFYSNRLPLQCCARLANRLAVHDTAAASLVKKKNLNVVCSYFLLVNKPFTALIALKYSNRQFFFLSLHSNVSLLNALTVAGAGGVLDSRQPFGRKNCKKLQTEFNI